tara:strand:- start:749 stop:1003 length:255 start_codon:yes stop_codon:yes gene_type:complete
MVCSGVFILIHRTTNQNQIGDKIMLENYFTREQLLTELGISSSTLQRLMSEDLPFIKIRNRVLFSKEDINNYLKEHTHNKMEFK